MGTKAQRKHLARKGIKVEIIHCKPVAPPQPQTEEKMENPRMQGIQDYVQRANAQMREETRINAGAFVEAQRQSVDASVRSLSSQLSNFMWSPSFNARPPSESLTAEMINEIVGRLGRTGSEYLGIPEAMRAEAPSSRAGRLQTLLDAQAQFGVTLDPALLEEPSLPYERLSDINIDGEEES